MFKNASSQKLIIFSLLCFFLLSAVWLFSISEKYQNPQNNPAWWALYFENPEDSSLNFVVENHGRKQTFAWEILEGKNILQTGSQKISAEEKTNISVSRENIPDAKIIVRVSADGATKEIYKNF
jgi:hypothetical protein